MISPFKQKLQLLDSSDVTTSTFTILHVSLCGSQSSCSTDSPYHVGLSSYSAEAASACSRECTRQMGPRGRREVIFTIQPLFSSPQTDNCLQNSTDSLMSKAIEAYKPRQQCLFLAVSAGVCTACLGITLFTLGGWRQLAPMGLRTGRGYSHFFLYALKTCLLVAFGSIWCKRLGQRRPVVM